MAWLDDQVFRRLCTAREQLLDTDVALDVVARDAGMARAHFGRRFHAVFGATPHQLRTASRIERAKTLLVSDQLDVTAVCLALGFSSLGSFSTLFRAHVGVSPTAYRRRVLVSVPELRAPGCLSLIGFLPADAFRTFREASDGRAAADSPT